VLVAREVRGLWMTGFESPPRTVEVLPYDEAWPRQFLVEGALLAQALPDALRIEHVGSTSVPGLAAKPTIDILAVVGDITRVRADRAGLERIGYQYRPASFADDPDHLFFRKVSGSVRTHHLHVLASSSPRGDEYCLVRDYLRANRDAARRYEQVKLVLARRYATDRGRYVAEKSAIVSAVQAEADQWAHSSR
jgi:GrpB-like predicted nucleotidyltransferase (UPF0157 family)